MRKLVLAAVVASLLVMPAGPVPAHPSASAGVDQLAIAIWFNMHGKTVDIHGAFGFRGSDGFSNPLSGEGFVFSGTCTRRRGRHGHVVFECLVQGAARELAPEDLVIDPLLGSAEMHLKGGGYNHTMRWEGKGVGPRRDLYVGSDDNSTLAMAGLHRRAKPEGRLFGHRLRAGGFGYLIEGAGVWTRLSALGIDVDFGNGDGNQFVLTRRIEGNR